MQRQPATAHVAFLPIPSWCHPERSLARVSRQRSRRACPERSRRNLLFASQGPTPRRCFRPVPVSWRTTTLLRSPHSEEPVEELTVNYETFSDYPDGSKH